MGKDKNIFRRIRIFLLEVRGELKKVTWPTKNDLYKTTIAVVVSSFIFGVYLFLVDWGFGTAFQAVIKLFSR